MKWSYSKTIIFYSLMFFISSLCSSIFVANQIPPLITKCTSWLYILVTRILEPIKNYELLYTPIILRYVLVCNILSTPSKNLMRSFNPITSEPMMRKLGKLFWMIKHCLSFNIGSQIHSSNTLCPLGRSRVKI